jgi:hypothetical protein
VELDYQIERLNMQRYPPDVDPVGVIPRKDHPEDYEVPNGLLGGRRDMFLKLSAYHGNNPYTVRQMHGISSDTTHWKDDWNFDLIRKGKLKTAQHPDLLPPPPPRPKFKYPEPIAKQHLRLSKI